MKSITMFSTSHRQLLRAAIVLCVLLGLAACTATVNLPKAPSKKQAPPQRSVVKEASKADKTKIFTELARGYLKQKQYSVAKDELEKVLALDTNHSEGNYVMALLMMELEQFEKAEKHFEKAVNANADNSAAAHDFGMFLCQTGQEKRAIKYFEKAAANPLFPRAELSNMRAGECLAKIGDPTAETYLRNALKNNPHLRPALYRLARIKYDAASYLSARAYIERYLAISKPQPASLLLAYRIELKLNALEMANEYRTQLLEEFPGSKQASALRRRQSQ